MVSESIGDDDDDDGDDNDNDDNDNDDDDEVYHLISILLYTIP